MQAGERGGVTRRAGPSSREISFAASAGAGVEGGNVRERGANFKEIMLRRMKGKERRCVARDEIQRGTPGWAEGRRTAGFKLKIKMLVATPLCWWWVGFPPCFSS